MKIEIPIKVKIISFVFVKIPGLTYFTLQNNSINSIVHLNSEKNEDIHLHRREVKVNLFSPTLEFPREKLRSSSLFMPSQILPSSSS